MSDDHNGGSGNASPHPDKTDGNIKENAAYEIGPREWLIAIAVSFLLIVVCVAAGFLFFNRVSAPPTETPAISTQRVTREVKPSNTSAEQPQSTKTGQEERLSFSESLESSYLFTNPVESIGCLLVIFVLLGGIFLLDAYLRRRRSK